MKKITLLVLALFIFGLSYGQQILSHSTDNATFDGGSIACAGGGTTADNIFYRSYTPSDFGFTGNFDVMGASFPIAFTDVSGGATAEITVRFSTSDDVFPAGTLTEIASETLTIDVNNDFSIAGTMEVLLTTTVTVDAATEIIVGIDVPDNIDPNMYDVRIVDNGLGQAAPGYIFSVACGLNTPTDYAAIGFPDNHIILDLIGDENLSVSDNNLSENISLFPNPTNGDLNLNFTRSLGELDVNVINVNGQVVLSSQIEGIGNSTLATSKLANGVYFAQVASDSGTATIKFIKN